jgi:hypothetical protein
MAPLTWNTVTYRYLDKGTLYLTDEQQAAQYLQVRVRVLKYSPPISESYLRNPAQSVYGYSTLCSNGCVLREVQQRYAYQVVADFFEDTTAIQQTACEYFKTTNDNNFGAFNAVPAIGPFVFGNVAGIFPTLAFPVDSIRYVGAQEQVFEFQVFWIPIGGESPCLPSKEKPPEPAEPEAEAPERDEDSSPPLAPDPDQDSSPDDDNKTVIPPGADSGDFGPRNIDEPPIPTEIGTWTLTYNFNQFGGGPGSDEQTDRPGYADSVFSLVSNGATGLNLRRVTTRIGDDTILGLFSSEASWISQFAQTNFRIP